MDDINVVNNSEMTEFKMEKYVQGVLNNELSYGNLDSWISRDNIVNNQSCDIRGCEVRFQQCDIISVQSTQTELDYQINRPNCYRHHHHDNQTDNKNVRKYTIPSNHNQSNTIYSEQCQNYHQHDITNDNKKVMNFIINNEEKQQQDIRHNKLCPAILLKQSDHKPQSHPQHQQHRNYNDKNRITTSSPLFKIIPAINVTKSSLQQITTLLLIILGLLVTPTRASYDVCSDAENDLLLPCHPSIFDAANLANLQLALDPSDATCGSPRTTYQRLGDRSDTIYNCDASSTTGDAHPLSNIIDADRDTWWQSISQSPGTSDLNINLTISLHKLFRFAGDIILTFNSGRPEKMILEKSVDNGETWTPLQFYARNCEEFGDQVDVDAEVTMENPEVVICTNRYVELKSQPRPGGRVTFDLNERFNMFLGPTLTDYTTYYQALDTKMLDFLIFSDLRFRFFRPASDGRGNYDEYYYAIQDMNIMARCFCNLHASSCVNNGNGLECACQHNTQGVNCEECLPLYNERPWQRGNYVPYNDGVANECKKCECNDHADSCTFDADYGRGVCNDCQHNTRGNHCENCMEAFYPNTTTTVNDSDRCLACDCNTLGVDGENGVCAQTAKPPFPIGQCVCKEQVTGRQCDSCVPGFYGLLEEPNLGNCTACECNLDGTVGQSNQCGQSGGQCPCKDSITGRQCDTCRDEYFGFPTGNPQHGCTPCGCSEGGSLSLTCDKLTGKCSCKPGIDGDKCDRSASGSYVSAIDSLNSDPGVVSANCDVTSDEYTDGSPFDGTTFAQCDVGTSAASVTFDFAGGMIQAALQWPYYPTIRYTNKNQETITGKLTMTYQGNTDEALSPLSERLGGGGITPGCPAASPEERDITLAPGSTAAVVLTDNPVVIDGRCKIQVTLTLNSLNPIVKRRRKRQAIQNERLIQVDSVSLLPALSTLDGTTSLTLYGSASEADRPAVVTSYQECLQKVAVLTTRNGAMAQAPCDQILFAVVSDIYGGAAECSCNEEGSLFPSQCASLGGQCTCKSGVGGRACDRCHEGYFNFTSSGCEECAPLPCPTPPPPPTTPPIPTTTTTTTTTITTPAPLDDDDDDDDDSLAPVFIVLITIALLVFLCIVIFCAYRHRTDKSRRKHVREGVRIMANLGLGDPNSPVYSNDIHQPHYNWVSQKQGVDNPAFVNIPDLPSDRGEDDSVFDSKTPTPTPNKMRPDFYIDSDNTSAPRQRNGLNNDTYNNKKRKDKEREREIDEKYKLSPPQVKKSQAEKQRKHFENERRELNKNPRYVDLSDYNVETPEDREIVPFDRNQSASISDLYAVPNKKNKNNKSFQTKPRSSSMGTEMDKARNGTAMNQWRPMEDLRMANGDTPYDSNYSESPTIIMSSPEMTSFKPLPKTDNSTKYKRNDSTASPPPPSYHRTRDSPSSHIPTAKVNAQPQMHRTTSHPSPPLLKNGIMPLSTQIHVSSPQKPKRQKPPKTKDSNNDNNNKNKITNNNDHDDGNNNNNNNNNKKAPLRKQSSSRFDKIYPPPAMFGVINPIYIPDPDYSINGDLSEPMVYIPKPDYPMYAGYESFDEFNGSLV